mgnify:CR=1 FL=1
MKGTFYYDASCGFCNASIERLQSFDRTQQLKFEPLQGAQAEAQLPKELIESLDTAVFETNEAPARLYLRSDAVCKALIATQHPIAVFATIALWIPKPLRDLAYNWVAKNRNRCELK